MPAPSYPMPQDLLASTRIKDLRHARRILRMYAKRTPMYAAALRYVHIYGGKK